MDHELLGAIRQVVEEEIRAAEMNAAFQTMAPLPSDTKAEEAVLQAVAAGDFQPIDFRPLLASDFFVPLHREVFVAMSALEELSRAITETSVGVTLKAAGVPLTDEVLYEVRWLFQGTRSEESVNAAASRVLECSRKRRMIRWLQSMEQELRTGNASVDSLSSRMFAQLEKRQRSANSPASSASGPMEPSG